MVVRRNQNKNMATDTPFVATSPCRVLYSAVYGDDLHQQVVQVAVVDTMRLTRKEHIMQLTARVQSEYGFRLATKEQTIKPKEDDNAGEEICADRGLFRLSPGDPFSSAKTVVWVARDECAYVLVCELDENYIQADSILTAIIKLVIEYVTSHEQRNAEVMLKSEKMSVILNHFLPCGQLLFLNHKLQAQLERQVEKSLAVK